MSIAVLRWTYPRVRDPEGLLEVVWKPSLTRLAIFMDTHHSLANK